MFQLSTSHTVRLLHLINYQYAKINLLLSAVKFPSQHCVAVPDCRSVKQGGRSLKLQLLDFARIFLYTFIYTYIQTENNPDSEVFDKSSKQDIPLITMKLVLLTASIRIARLSSFFSMESSQVPQSQEDAYEVLDLLICRSKTA